MYHALDNSIQQIDLFGNLTLEDLLNTIKMIHV